MINYTSTTTTTTTNTTNHTTNSNTKNTLHNTKNTLRAPVLSNNSIQIPTQHPYPTQKGTPNPGTVPLPSHTLSVTPVGYSLPPKDAKMPSQAGGGALAVSVSPSSSVRRQGNLGTQKGNLGTGLGHPLALPLYHPLPLLESVAAELQVEGLKSRPNLGIKSDRAPPPYLGERGGSREGVGSREGDG
ncbi:hypothetical protein B484DRAFT_414913, partial [Ochromonadaceae sp. CCMP2298]